MSDDLLPKILIVDDKPANLLALRTLLSRVEAVIFSSSSGEDALALALEHDFALILLDVQMPGMDGFEVAEFLRGEEQTRHMPILFVTAAYSDELHRLKGYHVGAVDYIQKPIDDRILLCKVGIFLDLYNQRQALSRHARELDERTQALEAEIVQRKKTEDELRLAKVQAEAAAEARSHFLASISHEIRTPLNGVLGMAQLLENSPLNDKQLLYVETIRNSGRTLLTVVNEVLDFSKIQAEKVVLEEIPFDLTQVTREALQLFSTVIEEKGLGVVHRHGDDLPKVLVGDPNRLRQILFNLLSNATKFTSKGEIALLAELATPEGDEEQVRVRFTVRDTGIGISDEARTGLFQPFVQGDPSINRKYGGTGLGLAIAANLARLMGGEMIVESTPGQGSTFFFTACFGQWSGERRDSQSRAIFNQMSLPTDRSVLVVEDDPVNRMIVREMVHALGFSTIHLAISGEEALEMLLRIPCDLVLMDIQMPGLDGYETTRAIRRREEAEQGGRLPIIALTANALAEERARCLNSGMDDFLTKPLEMEELASTLLRHLSRERLSPIAAPLKSLEAETAPLDRDAFNQLRLLLGAEKLAVLVSTFLDSLPDKVAGIRESLERADTEQLHRRAHTLKGNCGMLKANGMFQVCRDIVELTRAGQVMEIKANLTRLENQQQLLVVALKEETANKDIPLGAVPQ